MLLHRFGTLEHIIASTELFFTKKTVNNLTEDDLVKQNAVEIAKELQAIRGIDEVEDDTLASFIFSFSLMKQFRRTEQ
jgi:hypothetical protein